MELTLNAADRELLMEILQEEFRRLLWEIARANHREFKDALKDKAERVESLISKLELAKPAEAVLTAA
jgi:hypothetical protein